MHIEIHDELRPEDNAMIQALYSRSPASVADHLRDLENRDAGSFMDRYYVGYGHASIGDCGSTTIFIEGVSMLVAKAIQDWPLYSGQEASTRYMDFSRVPFVVSPRVGLGRETSEIQENWRTFYLSALEPTKEHVRRQHPQKPGEDAKIYERAVAARTFDILRAFLPAGATTNLSWHTNLRQANDHLSWLLGHPDFFVREAASSLWATLHRHYPSSFASFDRPTLDYQEELLKKDYFLTDYDTDEVLVDGHMVQYPLHSDEAFEHRPRGTPLPWYLAELGSIRSTFVLDFGSFRDLQRHRNGVIRMPLLTTDIGFHPWYLAQLPDELRERATDLLDKQQDAISDLDCSAVEAQNFIAMGYLVPCRVTQPLPAFVYRLELRSSKTVHPTLRQVVLEEVKQFRELFPSIVLHVDEDPDDWTIRRGKQTIVARESASEFKQYRRSKIAELRPYVPGETLSDRVSISAADLEAGSPKPGDMIARNPKNHDDQWLVAADYFADNFEPTEE